ncbi:MAG: hypothetical protein HY651_10700 [Acidobacteria bacterium]|nr:hypothetical protein [Acidobacteriota bacterium]
MLHQALADPETALLLRRALAGTVFPFTAGVCATLAKDVGGASATERQFGSSGCNTNGSDYSFPASIGIGTTSPGDILTLSRTATDVAIAIANTTSGARTWALDSLSDGRLDIFNKTESGAYLSLRKTSHDVLLNPDGSGKVGIGTTSPGTTLDVAGPIRFQGYAKASLPSTGTTLTDDGKSASGTLNATGAYVAQINTAGDSYLLGGKLGIGAQTPQTSLDVSGAIRSTLTTVTSGSTPTFNAALGNSFKMILNQNVSSSSITNGQGGQIITLILCQDGSGNRTMTWPTNLKLAGGAFTLTTTANKCDVLTAIYDGTNWYEIARATNE